MAYKEVLLVDDDEDDQLLFVNIMRSISPDTSYTIASNGLKAFQMLQAKTVVPDLIVLDLNMPVMNGQELLVRLKQHEELKPIPVIVLTTLSDKQTKERVLKLGAHRFVTKPDSIHNLEDVLHSVLGIANLG